MRVRVLLLLVLMATLTGGMSVGGQARAAALPPAPPPPAVPAECEYDDLASGALYLICIPTLNWNGEAVIWNHGYVAPQLPLDFNATDTLRLVDGTYLPDIVLGLGYAFAATSYRSNGLAALDAVDDVRLLLARYRELRQQHGPPGEDRVYVSGASMGGLVTTLLAERYPESFDGALAACGVVGGFRRQVNYWGDFRVLFDYFFPGVLPGSPVSIPTELILNWQSTYVPAIIGALSANPGAARQLIAATKAPIDPARPTESTVETTLSLLWYNVFATNEAGQRLGGNPYDNVGRIYWGSDNDWALNRGVKRFAAARAAVAAMAKFETSGQIRMPVVMPHTTRDQIVKIDQTLLYWLKARPRGDGSVLPIPIVRYGHCTFTAEEVVLSFGLLIFQTTGRLPVGLAEQPAALSIPGAQAALEAQLAAFRAAEETDAAAQDQGAEHRVFMPSVSR